MPSWPFGPLVPGQAGGSANSRLGQVGQGAGAALLASSGMAALQPKMALPAVTLQSTLPNDQAPRAQKSSQATMESMSADVLAAGQAGVTEASSSLSCGGGGRAGGERKRGEAEGVEGG